MGGAIKTLEYHFPDMNTSFWRGYLLFIGISIAFKWHIYQSASLVFLPLKLETSAYRHSLIIAIHLQCKSDVNDF